jgi:5-methylcytosine-specific restriction protein A
VKAALSLYGRFLQYMKSQSPALKNDEEAERESPIIDEKPDDAPVVNAPEPKPDPLISSGRKLYIRDPKKAAKALKRAGYQCELDSSHKTFVSRATGKPYVEAHHLIPVNAQDDFSNSLDVMANIVCLCPECHRLLHYGKDIEAPLRTLYEKRKSQLHECGIDITFEKLLSYYLG